MIDQLRASPDGQWIAYNVSEGGRAEVYVVPNPPAGQRFRVSPAGGAEPRWHPGGEELFYLSLDGTLMTVPVSTEGGLRLGQATPLFQTGLEIDTQSTQYAVSADGERFLLKTNVGPATETVVVRQDWLRALEQLTPAD
jgi:hypothetical protein